MTWLDECRLKVTAPEVQKHWSRIINELNNSTFVKHVDPEKGKAIMLSRPVKAITKDWSAYVDDKKDKRSQMAVKMLEGDREDVLMHHDLFSLYGNLADLEAGGTKENIKRIRAIAKVMKNELGEINDTWLAQIMYACTGRPYNRENIKPYTKNMK